MIRITSNGTVPDIDAKVAEDFLQDTHFASVQNEITNQPFHTMDITNTITSLETEAISADQIRILTNI